MKHARFIVLTAMMSFVLTGCDCKNPEETAMCLNGTGTGNPNEPTPTHGSTGEFAKLTSFKILNSVCTKLSACHGGLTYNVCESTLMTRPDLADAVGVPVGAYPTHFFLIQEEWRQAVVPRTEAPTCLLELEALACADAGVVGAYDPTGSDPYAAVAGILTPSCATALEIGTFSPTR